LFSSLVHPGLHQWGDLHSRLLEAVWETSEFLFAIHFFFFAVEGDYSDIALFGSSVFTLQRKTCWCFGGYSGFRSCINILRLWWFFIIFFRFSLFFFFFFFFLFPFPFSFFPFFFSFSPFLLFFFFFFFNLSFLVVRQILYYK